MYKGDFIMIGILGAMEEEILAFKEMMSDIEEINIHGLIFYKGKLNSKELVVCKCGVGKVSSARTTSILLTQFNVDLVINVGIAGGNSKYVVPRDIVIANKVSYADADLTPVSAWNYQFGQMSGCPRFFLGDESTNAKLKAINSNIKEGLILSSDTFVADPRFVKNVSEKFEDFEILAFDMESASIAQICYFEKVPFAILRYISDVCGESKQFEVYNDVKNQSSYTLIEIVKEYLL